MKAFSKFKNVIIPVLVSIALFACENNVEEEPAPPGGGGDGGSGSQPCDPGISFATSIKPIIDSRCIQCHNGSVQFPDLRTFEGISNNAENIKSQVVSRSMPIGGTLTEEQIELIRCWVENGALNN